MPDVITDALTSREGWVKSRVNPTVTKMGELPPPPGVMEMKVKHGSGGVDPGNLFA